MSRKPRGLRPDEEELWSRVARTAVPLPKANAKPRLIAKPNPPEPVEPAFKVPEFRVGEKADTACPGSLRPKRPPSKWTKKPSPG